MELYKIAERYKQISELSTEFLSPEEIQKSLANIEGEFEEKADSIAKTWLSIKAEHEAIQFEIDRLIKKDTNLAKTAESMKNYLYKEMSNMHIDIIKKDVVTLKIAQNPPKVEIIDENIIPKEYLRETPAVWNPDKKAIMAHLKETGELVPGTDVIYGTRLDIK